MDFYSQTYDKFILCGDFNAEVSGQSLSTFMNIFGLKCLIKENTCFKSLETPSSVDLFLTNSNKSFQHTSVISAGISDFHKMIITVMKTTFEKLEPKEINYRDYKDFDEDSFRSDLKNTLHCEKGNMDFTKFQNLFLQILNSHAQLKKKMRCHIVIL